MPGLSLASSAQNINLGANTIYIAIQLFFKPH
jgi:hypothetical protein